MNKKDKLFKKLKDKLKDVPPEKFDMYKDEERNIAHYSYCFEDKNNSEISFRYDGRVIRRPTDPIQKIEFYENGEILASFKFFGKISGENPYVNDLFRVLDEKYDLSEEKKEEEEKKLKLAKEKKEERTQKQEEKNNINMLEKFLSEII